MKNIFISLFWALVLLGLTSACSGTRDLTSYYIARDILPVEKITDTSGSLDYTLLYREDQKYQGQLDLVSIKRDSGMNTLVVARYVKTMPVRVNQETRELGQVIMKDDQQLREERNNVAAQTGAKAKRSLHFMEINAEQAQKLREALADMQKTLSAIDVKLKKQETTRSLHYTIDKRLTVQMRAGLYKTKTNDCLLWLDDTRFSVKTQELEEALRQFLDEGEEERTEEKS